MHVAPSQILASHLLAYVVSQLFPTATLVGGGVHSLGFYYDFILDQPLTEKLLDFIGVHLQRVLKENHTLRFISMMRENACALLEHHQHFLLAEQVSQESANILEFVQIGEFYGLCPACPLSSTGEVGWIKLLEFQESIREIREEKFLISRIIGICQSTAKDLKVFSKKYASFLKKKDHRALGPKLNLFSASGATDCLGVVWHAKGLILRRLLQDLITTQLPEDIQRISTPTIVKQRFFKEKETDSQAFSPFSFQGQAYQLRSSPLEQHLEVFQKFDAQMQDLPWKIMEYASVYHAYPEPQWWGLLCNCAYLIDLTTICCAKEQVISEMISSLHFIEQIITIFDLEAQWYLIASREKCYKAQQEQEAIAWLRQAIQSYPRAYPFCTAIMCEGKREEGPRLELRVRDGLGREWPTSTIRVVQHVKKIDALSLKKAVFTQQVWGSLDRLVALLLERYEGHLPLWLAPEQARVITIGEVDQAYAKHVSQRMQDKGLRVGVDLRQVKLSLKVHEAEIENIPYLILLGEQERIKQTISVRAAGKAHQRASVNLDAFLNKLDRECLSPLAIERKTMLKGESELA